MEIAYLEDLATVVNGRHNNVLQNGNVLSLIVTFPVKPGVQARFLTGIRRSITLSRAEEGNIAYNVHAVNGEPTKFIIYERWKDQAALDIHFKKPNTGEL